MSPLQLTRTPADLITLQNDLVRTKDYIRLGKIAKIQFAPSADWIEPKDDPFIAEYGRLMDLRHNFLPVAQSLDRTMLILTAPLICREEDVADFESRPLIKTFMGNYRVGLPDVPVPGAAPEPWTPEESRGEVKRDPAKNRIPKVAQRLTDRCEYQNGRPAFLHGTRFLVFHPVTQIIYQPEEDGELLPTVRFIGSSKRETARPEDFYDNATNTYMSMVVNYDTGEAHFVCGRYDLSRGAGDIES